MKTKAKKLIILSIISTCFMIFFNITLVPENRDFEPSKSELSVFNTPDSELNENRNYFGLENKRCTITHEDFYLISKAGATNNSTEGKLAVRLFKPCEGRWKDNDGNEQTAVGIWVPPARHGGDLSMTDFIHFAALEGVATITMIYPGHSFEECDENGENCLMYISSEGYDDRGGTNTLLGISDLIEYAMGKSEFKTVGLNDEGHKDLYERLSLKSNDQIKNVGMISYSGGGTTSFPALALHGNKFNDRTNKKFSWYAGLEHKATSGCQDSGWTRFDQDNEIDTNGTGIINDEGSNDYLTGIDENGTDFEYNWDYLVFDEEENSAYGTKGEFKGLVYFGKKPFEYIENGDSATKKTSSTEFALKKKQTFSTDLDGDMPIQKCNEKTNLFDAKETNTISNNCVKCPDGEDDGKYGPNESTGCAEDWPVTPDKWYFANNEPSTKESENSSLKVIYAPKIRENLEELYPDLSDKFPHFATVEETNEYWRYRQMAPLVPVIKDALPNLKFIISFNKWEHRQAARVKNGRSTHPCVQILTNNLLRENYWTRVNSDSSYTTSFAKKYCNMMDESNTHSYDESKAMLPPDNKANRVMTDLNSHGMGIPVNLCSDKQKSGANVHARDMSFAAAIVEMADRSYDNNWDVDLDYLLHEK